MYMVREEQDCSKNVVCDEALLVLGMGCIYHVSHRLRACDSTLLTAPTIVEYQS